MDEQEFDALMQSRPFGTEDAKRVDLRLRRCASLASTLWGKTPGDLRRQLLAASPDIPGGFDLADFRELLRTTEQLLAGMTNPRNEVERNCQRSIVARLAFAYETIVVRTRQYTAWEARREIVRRAIEYLEKR